MRPQRRFRMARAISALMLREIATTYGRSPVGYAWAILEPAAGIMLLVIIFSAGFRSPPIGTSFAIFYATGIIPLFAYIDVAQKTAQTIRFSKPLLFYPAVTFVDALLARVLLNALTQATVGVVIFSLILVFFTTNVTMVYETILLSFGLAIFLGAGLGTLNAYLFAISPGYERIWSVLTRPLFIISCVFFLFDTVPQPYRDILWWNPLIHIIGLMRSAFYPTYDAAYVSVIYVCTISAVCLALGLVVLRRYYRDIIHD